MRFITQGKTDWKYLLIIFALSAILTSGALWFNKNQEIYPSPFVLPEISHGPKSEGDSGIILSESEITLSQAENKKGNEVTNKNGSVFLLEFSMIKKELNTFQIQTTVKEKKNNEVIQSLEDSCYLAVPYLRISFFDLDKNGFIDFNLDSCNGGSYNIGDTLYLFNPAENKYASWYVSNPGYDFNNSFVRSSARGGLEGAGYSIYKATDGKLVEVERGWSDLWGSREQVEKLINNQWVMTKDYSIELDGNKCVYSVEELINGQSRTILADIYHVDDSGYLVRESKKFNERGEVVESSLIEFSQQCKELLTGTILESKEDCTELVKGLAGLGC